MLVPARATSHTELCSGCTGPAGLTGHRESGGEQKWDKEQMGNPVLPQQKKLIEFYLCYTFFKTFGEERKKKQTRKQNIPVFPFLSKTNLVCGLVRLFASFQLFFFRQNFPGIKVGSVLKDVEENIPEENHCSD